MSKRLRSITLISNLLKITSRAISKRIEYSIVNSKIMTRAKFAYFKDRPADEVVRSIKDIIADSNLEDDPNKSFFIPSSDYSAVFDLVSREYIYNVLRWMNFPERTINLCLPDVLNYKYFFILTYISQLDLKAQGHDICQNTLIKNQDFVVFTETNTSN